MKISSKLDIILNGIIERGKTLGYDLVEISKNKKYNLKYIAKTKLRNGNLTTVEKNFFNDIKNFHSVLELKIQEILKKDKNG